ncbi:MAG: hypothetical protein ACI4C1_04340 [Lachnospiraceae bacterium]
MEYCMLAGKRAEYPLVLEGIGIRLYSAEEVCYFIVHYLPLIDFDFFSAELFDFLDQECGWNNLAQKLREMRKKESCRFEDCVLTLLRSVNYYNENELAEVRRALVFMQKKGAEQNFLDRAGLLMEMKHYEYAAEMYKNFLESGEQFEMQSAEFRETLYYNLAVCMIYLNDVKQAMEYLLCSFHVTQHPFMKQAIVELAWMEQLEIPMELRTLISETELIQWKKEYQIAVRESEEEMQVEREAGKIMSIERWIEQEKDVYRRSVGE